MNGFSLNWVAVLAALFMFSLPAFGHAGLVRSAPANGEVVPTRPEKVELVFNSALQPGMNSIAVTDPAGKRVNTGEVDISPDGKTITVALSGIASGKYRVEWRALSADDHTIRGEFSFEVAAATVRDQDQPSVETVMPADTAHDHSMMDHGTPADADAVNWPQSTVRWLMYLAMMAIFGGFTFERFIAGKEPRPASSGYYFTLIAVLLAAAFASLFLQVATVFDVPVSGAFDPQLISRLIFETSYGYPWLLLVAAGLALALAVVLRRTYADSSVLSWMALLLAGILFLSPALSGHARAASTEYRFAIVLDWIHLAAAAVWIGGLIRLALTVRGQTDTTGPQTAALISRFTTVAITATIILALTGIYNTWIHVESLSALVSTAYGYTLLAKIAFFIPMVILGGINSFIIRPRIESGTGDTRAIRRNVSIEIALAVIVLLLAAILAFLPPAREHPPASASAATGVQVTS